MASGTYVENISWPAVNGIKLFGTGRDSSIIDGNQLASVIRFETANVIDSTTIVRGFTLTNGFAQPPWPRSEGGGIHIYYSSPILEYLNITGNRADDFGGGIFIWGSSSHPIIRYVVIANNSSDGSNGGVDCFAGAAIFDHITVADNTPGGMYFSTNEYPKIINSIIAYNYSFDVRINGNSFEPTTIGIGYSDIANGIQLIGYASYVSLGPNLELNPKFVNYSAGNYSLQPNSPCIDAGDPSYPNDPDATRTDMGVFYFDQSVAPAVRITMTPVNPPIQIPTSGGSFSYTGLVDNMESTPQTFNVWVMATWYALQTYGPLLGPLNLTLPANTSLSRTRMQTVPASAPGGTYTYTGLVGIYPNVLYDVSEFTFQKAYAGDGPLITGWSNQGESFDAWLERNDQASPAQFALLGAYPNPFNPTTTIRYQIPMARKVSLKVYDTAGRLVTTLVGFGESDLQQAGTHAVIFDGSNLASGVYLAKLQAGEFTAVQKVVMMK